MAKEFKWFIWEQAWIYFMQSVVGNENDEIHFCAIDDASSVLVPWKNIRKFCTSLWSELNSIEVYMLENVQISGKGKVVSVLCQLSTMPRRCMGSELIASPFLASGLNVGEWSLALLPPYHREKVAGTHSIE
jgi:hypothetical protein